MSVPKILLASVCSAFLAASAAGSGALAATENSKLVSQAYEALQVGDADAAVRTYGLAIESRNLEPEVLANALLNRGLAYQRLNEHQMAIGDYTAAMRIDAMSGKLRALALYNRGLSFQRLQQNPQAIEDFTSALFLDSQFSHAYYSRGTLLRDAGQHLFALADFDKALRFDYPDAARVYFAQSLTFEKLRRPADARESLTKAIAANPQYEPAIQRLAVLDGKATPKIQEAAASDQIVTAAVSSVVPKAQAPAARLLAEDAEAAPVTMRKVKNKIADRVPAENMLAKAGPAPTPAESAEKIVEIENVPEETAGAGEPVQDTAAGGESSGETQPGDQPISGWSVQIASAATENAAWSTWKKMQARHKALAMKEPVVVRADLGARGVFYRVRLVGFGSQSDAGSECAKLKAKGVKCYVSKAAS